MVKAWPEAARLVKTYRFMAAAGRILRAVTNLVTWPQWLHWAVALGHTLVRGSSSVTLWAGAHAIRMREE